MKQTQLFTVWTEIHRRDSVAVTFKMSLKCRILLQMPNINFKKLRLCTKLNNNIIHIQFRICVGEKPPTQLTRYGHEFDPDIVFFTYFDFCDHSWLTINMISALKSLGLYIADIPLIELLKSKYIKSKTRCRGLVYMGPQYDVPELQMH